MSKLARTAAAVSLAAALVGGAAASAVADSGKNSGNKRSYECVNWGGGPEHSVDCSSDIIVNGVVVDDITINISDNDVRVLSDNELDVLENSLNDVDVDILNITTYLKNLEVAVLNAYKSFNIDISAANIKACSSKKKVCI